MDQITLLFWQVFVNIIIFLGSDLVAEDKRRHEKNNSHNASLCVLSHTETEFSTLPPGRGYVNQT